MSFSRQKAGGYDIFSTGKYTPDINRQAQELYGRTVPGVQKGIDFQSGLAGGDQSAFDELEAPAMRQFLGTQGQLASRFSGKGTGARRSSGFGLETSGAAQTLAESMKSKRLDIRNQAIESLYGMSNQLLGRNEQDRFAMEQKPKGWQKWAGALAPVAGAAIGGAFGGPMGAQMGYSAGSAAGKAFF
jgi:hypothetical protein